MTGLRRHRLKQAEIFLKLGEHQHYDGSVFASGARASKRSCGKGGHGATERAKKRHLTTAGGKSGGKYYCGTKKSSNFNCGEMPEWSNGAVSKTVVLSRVPRVRIPVSPPFTKAPIGGFFGEWVGATSARGASFGEEACLPNDAEHGEAVLSTARG